MPNTSHKRILVVDDIPHWRKLLSTLLKDYNLEIIDSYADAVNAIEQSEFSVVILDIRLEDQNIFNVDGVDLLKKIKREQPNTSIVILTGYRESIHDQILLEYGPRTIIDKGTFDNNEFRELIQELVGKD